MRNFRNTRIDGFKSRYLMYSVALKEEKQLSIRFRALPRCQWKFGTDYNVGDIVTLESPDRGSLNLQIYAAESYRWSSGDDQYLDLGYECATPPSLIKGGKGDINVKK